MIRANSIIDCTKNLLKMVANVKLRYIQSVKISMMMSQCKSSFHKHLDNNQLIQRDYRFLMF